MIEGYDELKEIALDLSWSWNHRIDKVWAELDSDLWNLTHNPWIVLQSVSRAKLKKSLADPKFRQVVDSLIEHAREKERAPAWFQKNHPKALNCIAYFSMEFMLSEGLPIYSGGLGNVAGDQLKAASDLGVPVVAIGLLYAQGYFRQIIDKYGRQQAIYPYNDPGQLPISPLRKPDGEWLRLKLDLPGWSVWTRAWEARIGRVKLYLLDTNDAANFPVHRGITSELYGGDEELRLKQELVLGIGGWRLLRTLGLEPEVCHLNEGHAAFAVLERARWYMQESGQPFDVAMAATRPGNLFTTHTAVSAGFDKFPSVLLQAYLGAYSEEQLKIPFKDLLSLGQESPDSGKEFNMAYLAIRGSGVVNGVSLIHGKVSRQLFHSLFPRWPENEIPVGSVTNGVHMPSWDSSEADQLWTKYCGKPRWLEPTENLEEKMKKVPDKELWEMREKSRQSLIDFARGQLSYQLKARGECLEAIEKVEYFLDPSALTLGFARRFASYKRPNLLLHDPRRLIRILTNPHFPVQLILAGKAHPADQEGQTLIRNWMQFIFQNEQVRSRVIFLNDYDMLVTEQLVQGTDVWINTPRRPWEACGTSGMKILVNGGLNLSELDGWWAEAYAPDVGWAIGDALDHDHDLAWDAAEANTLYELLERQVVPEFYRRNQEGIPVGWIAKIRESMARLTPYFSANRTVREYTERYYLPSADRYRKRIANQATEVRQMMEWKARIERNWPKLQFGKLKAIEKTFEVELFLGDLDPSEIKVELFANGDPPFHQEMQIIRRVGNNCVYGTAISSNQPTPFFTPRATPFHQGVSVPLEMTQILWQK